MIRSMTAFARARQGGRGVEASVEIRSVNHRFLEVHVRMPRSLAQLEGRVKNLVSQAVARGRVDVFLDVKKLGDSDTEFAVNTELARSFFQAASALKKDLGLEEEVSLSHILREEGVLVRMSPEPDLEKEWSFFTDALASALKDLVSMREKEGEALRKDFDGRIQTLSSLLDEIEKLTRDMPVTLKDKFELRIRNLVTDQVALDPSRVAQEAAFLADKADISEEITRARSHMEQFRSLLEKDEPSGRALNFLAQELLREFSTMGAKSSSAELSQVVVSAKAEVEKIREQIQNVE